MKTLLYTSAASLFFVVACTTNNSGKPQQTTAQTPKDTVKTAATNCTTLLAQARKLDSLLMTATSLSKPLAEQSIAAFEQYATSCDNDSIAPVFLFKGAQVAQAVMNVQKSRLLLEDCIGRFHGFRNRGAALFMLARLYDEHTMLNDEDEAKKIYEQIIKEYPNSPWEKDAKAAIANLGKTDEELVKEFEKKNKHS